MKYLIIISLFFSLSNCKKDKKARRNSIQEKNDITLIFEKRSYKKDTLFFNNNKSYLLKNNPNISYIDKYPYNNKVLSINNINQSDTIKIKTKGEITFKHNYHYYYSSSYIFKAGDTIKFSYINDAPYCKVLNKKKYDHQFNFEVDYNLLNKVYLNSIEYYYKNRKKRTNEQSKKYFKKLKNNRTKQLLQLDSLYKKNKIEKFYYQFLKEKLKYKINTLTTSSNLKNIHFDFKNDTLLRISSFRHFLSYYSSLKHKIPLAKNKHNIDYELAFDSVRNSSMFSEKNKNFLLYSYLKKIASNSSVNDFKNYYKIFKKEVDDSLLINKIDENYQINLSHLKNASNKVYLLNNKLEKSNLNDIIKQNKGNLIYIDFWASWCTPCRKAMKSSKKLSEKYKNKKIVFIYLSIDNSLEDWKKASKEEHIFDNSYKAINYPKANFYKNLSLNSIPRYLLYNENGKFIHKNAPSPSTKEIEKLINKHIK